MRLAAAMSLVAALSVSGCYLAHERSPVAVVEIDAAISAPDARDAARPRDTNDAAPFCLPGMPCDCFVGGELRWEHVLYAVSDATTVGGYGAPGRGWGDDLRLEARCSGVYTITATVRSGGSGCTLATVETVAEVSNPRFGTRARMPRWTANDRCASDALTVAGGNTCVSIAWSANGGGTGSTSLGCFAPFGPYCFGGPGCTGGGGMDDGATGEWSF